MRKKLGKNQKSMKNSDSKRIGIYPNKTKAGIEANYWRSKGYNTKTRKTNKGIIVFRSKNKKV
jgi:hypothetical protein